MMIDKKSLFIAIFTLISLFLLPSSFAAGCCINIPTGDVCVQKNSQTDCGAGSTFYDGQSCNTVQSCTLACVVCVAQGNVGVPNSPTSPIWEQQVLGCPQGQQVDHIDYSKTESTCNSQSTSTIPNLPDVSGKVTENNVAVQGAAVTCVGASATTDSSGNYQLVNCAETGAVTIYASKGASTGTATIPNLQADQTGINIQISSTQTATLTVTVKNQAGALIKANVTVGNQKSEQGTASPLQFTVPIGNVNVVTEKSGYASQSTTSPVLQSPAVNSVSVVLIPVPSANLFGFVYSGTTPVAGATVTVTNPVTSNVVSSATTDATGKYNFPSLPQGAYSVSANKAGVGSSSPISLSFTGNVQKDFILTQQATSQTTALQLTVLGPSGPVAQALVFPGNIYTDSQGKATLQLQSAQTYNIVINHPDYKQYVSPSVTGGTATYQAQLVPYTIVTVTGRVLNGSDSSKKAVSGAVVSYLGITTTTLNDGSFSFTAKATTSDTIPAYVKDPRFFTQPVNVKLTDLPTLSLGNIEIQQQSCTSRTVSLADPVQNGDKIQLAWSFSCKPDSYSLSRNNVPLTAGSNVDATTYSDSSISGTAQYCYQVTAYYNTGITGIVSVQSSKKCSTSSSSDCFDGEKTFCDGNIKKSCVKQGQTMNLVQNPCSPDQLCIETSATDAQCVQAHQCNLCNRPFGVFPYETSSNIFGAKGSNQSLFNFKLTGEDFFSCTEQSVACFADKSTTVVDKYYSCDNIHSCYDYASQEACTGAAKNKCTPSETCEWISRPDAYNELGVGVCRPVDKTKQDCNEFQKSQVKAKGLTNDVFASNTCQLYGDNCYFSTIQNSCLNKDQVSCYDYDVNKADCIGPTQNSPAKQGDVNVSWIITGTTYRKISGTNLLQKSSDRFSIGICRFIEGECIRDADNNQNATKYIISGGKKFESSQYASIRNGADCEITDPLYPICSTDVVPPSTFMGITNGSYTSLQSLNVTVADDSLLKNPSLSSRIKTWYNVTSEDSVPLVNTYPVKQMSNGKIGLGQEGKVAIFYFSEDASHNLEKVKRLDIVIDRTPPVVNFSTTIIPDLISHSVTFLPQLTLLSDKTGDVAAYCNSARLVKLDGGEISLANFKKDSTIDSAARNSWIETYQNIPTPVGIKARYYWTCYDLAGNKVSGSKDITLDSDMTIYDPQPDIAVHARTGINISVKTPVAFPGDCKFRDTPFSPSNYKSSSDFTTSQLPNGDYMHSAVVSVPSGDNKYYYVACNLTGIRGIVSGTDSDNIKLTIDRNPPTTDFVDSTGNKIPGEIWVSSTNLLTLRCNDTEQRVSGYPREIGCGSVFSCVDQDSQSQCTPQQSSLSVTPQISKTSNLRYYSSDNYGNAQNSATPLVKQVNYDGEAPSIIFDDATNNGFIETKDNEFLVLGKIINHGENDCVRGPGCSVSPFKDRGTSFKVTNSTGIISNGTLQIPDLNAETLQISQPIQLGQNQQNDIIFTTQDVAGNVRQSDPITVIQDNLGPDLYGSQNNPVLIEKTSTGTVGYSTSFLNVEYGDRFPVRIRNIVDKYPLSTFKDRVSSVWIEDMFGTRYSLTKTLNGWEGVINTQSWLPSKSFNTFIKIMANDTLGNVAERRIDEKDGFVVEDTRPPTAEITLENKYGEKVTSLVKGENYVVLRASESLQNASMFFSAGNKKYNVTFLAKDFDSLIWVGTIDVTDPASGNVFVDGIMHDSNGNPSNKGGVEFIHDPITINSGGLVEPRPAGRVLTGGIYNVTQSNTLYENYFPETFTYQFTVNGEIQTYDSISGITLKPGSNEVSIRVEDNSGDYEMFNQKLNVIDVPAPVQVSISDTTAPSINSQAITYQRLSTIDGNLVSRNTTVELNGPYSIGDATKVYSLGADGKIYLGTLDSGSFTIDALKLLGRTFEEKVNNIVLVFEDASGNKAEKTVQITKDLRPPHLIKLSFNP